MHLTPRASLPTTRNPTSDKQNDTPSQPLSPQPTVLRSVLTAIPNPYSSPCNKQTNTPFPQPSAPTTTTATTTDPRRLCNKENGFGVYASTSTGGSTKPVLLSDDSGDDDDFVQSNTVFRSTSRHFLDFLGDRKCGKWKGKGKKHQKSSI
jgi:hypothetical protein